MATKRLLSRINAVEVNHTVLTWGAVSLLAKYLKNNCQSFVHIEHPFEHMRFQKSRLKMYQKGHTCKNSYLPKIRGPTLVLFLQDLLLNIGVIFKSRKRNEFYIGADCLNALSGLFLRKIGFVEKVIFYSIDYSPNRFQNVLLNNLYRLTEKYVAKRANYVWCVSIRDKKEMLNEGAPLDATFVVPPGVDYANIHADQNHPYDSHKMVYIGNLSIEKGVQLVIEAMPQLKVIDPKISITIIGTGPYEQKLRELTNSLKLDNVHFLGHIRSQKEVFSIMQGCGISVAPYVPMESVYSQFAFPGKVVEYMSCGLPVVMTNVPQFSSQVQKNGAGLIIDYDKESFVRAVSNLTLNHTFYSFCRENALKFSRTFDYEKIFGDAFEEIFTHHR
jgi:glycosyltransferase involved in cell wall biosynthesis